MAKKNPFKIIESTDPILPETLRENIIQDIIENIENSKKDSNAEASNLGSDNT